MSTQKATRPVDAFQRIMASFTHFGNKLDKIQEDVNYHGQTLSELRNMVSSLSGGAILAPIADFTSEDPSKRLVNKTKSIQYEGKARLDDPKMDKKKKSVLPLSTKSKVTSFQSRKSQIAPKLSPFQVHGKKMELGTKGISQKHTQRRRKVDVLRKTNIQKLIETKRARQAK